MPHLSRTNSFLLYHIHFTHANQNKDKTLIHISLQPQRRLSSGVSAVPSGGGLTFLMQEAEDEDEDEDIDNPAKFVTQVGVSKEFYRLTHQVVIQVLLTPELNFCFDVS